MVQKILIEHELKVLHKSWEQDSHRTCVKSSNISPKGVFEYETIVKKAG